MTAAKVARPTLVALQGKSLEPADNGTGLNVELAGAVGLITGYVAHEPGLVAAYLGLLAAATVTGIIGLTKFTAALANHVSESDKGAAMKALAIVACLTVMLVLTTYGADCLHGTLSANFKRFATGKLVAKVLDANRITLLDVAPERYIAYVDSASRASYRLFSACIGTYLPNTVMLLCITGYMFFLDYKCGLVFAAGMGIVLLIFFLNKDRVGERARRAQVAALQANTHVSNVLSCVGTVSSKSTQQEELSAVELSLDARTSAALDLDRNLGLLNLVSVGAVAACVVLLMFIAVAKVGAPATTATAVLAIISLASTSKSRLSSLATTNIDLATEIGRYSASVLPELELASVSIGAVQLCASPPFTPPAVGGAVGGGVDEQADHVLCEIHIDFVDVSFRYPGAHRDAVSHFTYAFGPGVNVLTASVGSGKTTLARMLLRTLEPTSGVIRINGVPLPDIEASSLRKHVVFSSQDATMPDRSIREECTYGTRATEADLQAVWALIQHFFPGMYLDDHVGANGARLSSGMKQLLRTANVILCAAPCIILDDPFYGLDSATKAVALKMILEMPRSGATVLLITNDESAVESAVSVRRI